MQFRTLNICFELGVFHLYQIHHMFTALCFQVSNILYLDSPAGVGLSYSKNATDYKTGDLKTALDSHTFLLKVLKKTEEIKKFDIFV